MENQPVTTPVVTKQPSKKPLFLMGLLILVILIGAGYYISHKKSTDKSNDKTLPANWSEYKSSQYGFKFSYPAHWGTPNISALTADKGKTYSINFNNPKQAVKTSKPVRISISFDSDDMSKKVCGQDNASVCGSVKAFTSKDIQTVLASNNKSLITHDNNSYAILVNAPEMNLQNQLNIYRTIKLDNLNVSAVKGSYGILGSNKACPTDKLSANTSNDCINMTIYDDLNNSLKSLQKL